MDKALTIIIPAYNVAEYIGQGLDSLIQDKTILKFLDVIVVNDGSKDDTLKIVTGYCNLYPDSIRVIDKENGGHGSGINVGIEAAQGEYLKILDGDDWVNPDGLKELVEYIVNESSEADVIINPFQKVWEDGKKEIISFKAIKSRELVGFKEIVSNKYTLPLHTLTIRSDIYKDNQIPRIDEKISYDDMEYILFPVPYINTIVFLDKVVYEYRLGLSGQSMNPSQMKRKIEMHTQVVDRLADYHKNNEKIFNEAQDQYYIRELTDTIATNYMVRLHIGLTRKDILEFKDKYNCVPLNSSRNRRFKVLYKCTILSLITSLILHRH